MAEIVAAIQECVPAAEITWDGEPLPFPPELEAVGFDRDVGTVSAHAARGWRGGNDRAFPAGLRLIVERSRVA